ncbi:hypothetical protein GCM10022254_41080 [Actinomadura meridiana]|uniref:Uncharacterized protein n=1 Tax=Actinomadura meridiana TaxID=559626 RepID=A0ABP8C791_9ACTN
MGLEAPPELPQDGFEFVGRLFPESAWTFVRGRQVLHDLVGDRVSRFLREPSPRGQGCLLPRPLAAMLDSGALARISEADESRIYRERRESQGD